MLLAVILLITGIMLLVLDLFLPSGGVLTVLSVLCGIGAILFGFRHSFSAGAWITIVTLTAVPGFLWCFIRFWPHTPLGRRILIGLPEKQSYAWSGGSSVKDIRQLVGKTGRAETGLFPSGMVEIENQLFEAVSDSQGIERGCPIRIVRIDMGQVVVIAWEESQHVTTKPAPTSQATDALHQPIDELGLESIDGD